MTIKAPKHQFSAKLKIIAKQEVATILNLVTGKTPTYQFSAKLNKTAKQEVPAILDLLKIQVLVLIRWLLKSLNTNFQPNQETIITKQEVATILDLLKNQALVLIQ